MATFIDINHEDNNLSEYTGTSGSVATSSLAAMGGTSYGLISYVNNTTNHYAFLNGTSTSSGSCRIRVYFDPNGISADNGVWANIFTVWNPASTGMANIRFFKESDVYKVCGVLRNDSYADFLTDKVTISDAPHYIEMLIIRASGSSASNASVTFWVDGSSETSASGIDCYDELSSIYGISAGMHYFEGGNVNGQLYFDEIIANDTGAEIGPNIANLTVSLDTAILTIGGQSLVVNRPFVIIAPPTQAEIVFNLTINNNLAFNSGEDISYDVIINNYHMLLPINIFSGSTISVFNGYTIGEVGVS